MEWRTLKIDPDYQVSSTGLVRNRTRLLKQSKDTYGYLIVKLPKRTYRVHQLVAFEFLDHTPSKHQFVVDHINNNPADNRVENLQILTQRENLNKGKEFPGVSRARNKWQSHIYKNGKQRYLGTFDTPQSAHKAYLNELK